MRALCGDGVFVIAEIGVNHNGRRDLGCDLIAAAAEAGADAVKFQSFDADRLAKADAPKAAYQTERTGAGSQADMLRELALSAEDHRALKAVCAEQGVLFLSSPFDEDAIDFLQTLDVAAYKIPSGEITNHPYLAHMGRTGRPAILSTGMSTIEEVADAIAVLDGAGASDVALLHCVSAYPAPFDQMNLRAMKTMAERFGRRVGLSDHSLGATMAVAATALGARIIEKHITLDRAMDGPDHAASMEPTAFAAMIEEIRNVVVALGDGVKVPTAAERETALVARKSLVAMRSIAIGEVVAPEDLRAMRPGSGLPPFRAPDLVGRRAVRTIAAGAMIALEDVG